MMAVYPEEFHLHLRKETFICGEGSVEPAAEVLEGSRPARARKVARKRSKLSDKDHGTQRLQSRRSVEFAPKHG